MAGSSIPICGYVHAGMKCHQRGDHLCPGRVRYVHNFFEKVLVHTKGDFARKPFVPTHWQSKRIITPLFGKVTYDTTWKRYVRQYRELYLYIARKNGKSEILAAITLFMLIADGEESAEIYGLALDRDQASQVYRVAARMVELSPWLQKTLQVVRSTQRIIAESTASYYAVAAGDALGSLGGNPHCCYIDELLTQPSRDLYDVIRSGWGTRAQPLLLLATTAENDPHGFAASERQWSTRVLEDPSLDPRRLVVMFMADEESDWTKRETWQQANPALGDFLDEQIIADECHKAIANPSAERAFRQFRLNQPGQIEGRAINLKAWDNSAGEFDYRELPDELSGRIAYAGLDLASTSDLAAYALVFPDDDGGVSVLWRHFAPEAALDQLDRRTGGQASVWAQETDMLNLTDGDVIDYGAIIAAMERDKQRFDIREVAFDRWGATQLSMQLIDSGWPIIQVGQGFSSMSGPTRDLLRLVPAGQFRHGGNPLVRWQAANLTTKSDPAGNLKPDRSRRQEKIDGMVAAIMGLDRALRHSNMPEEEFAVAGF
jgi:phage terminase large subunit-like protein